MANRYLAMRVLVQGSCQIVDAGIAQTQRPSCARKKTLWRQEFVRIEASMPCV